MSSITATLVIQKIDNEVVSMVSVSLDLDSCEDTEFSQIKVLIPLPQNGILDRAQAHKALAKEFRKMLDVNYADEEFWINGLTAVSKSEAPERVEDNVI